MAHDLFYWHTRGEQDFIEHNGYNLPNDDLDIVLDPNEKVRDRMRSENRAYIEGYERARDQEG